jgi:uncharacterized protein (UPF0332 family)
MGKKVFDFKDCIRMGLLRRIPPSGENAERSMATAEEWLSEADRNLKAEAYKSGISSTYNAMFHAARAVLFLDGFREKSHACLSKYLEEHVRGGRLEEKWVNLLDRSRTMRHDNQYGIIDFSDRDELLESLRIAKEFVSRMCKLLDSLKNDRRNC